jgi:hypothetical protein
MLALGAGAGCRNGAEVGDGSGGDGAAEPPFVERAAEVGLDFTHFNGATGEFYFAESVGPGGALFDYDNDGDLDVYLVQGGMLDETPASAAIFPPAGGRTPRDRLFRNLFTESGELAFEDVTESAGIPSGGYGMGVATGDYDADGWIDVYVTNFDDNVMLRNRGDGTFEDVTGRARTGEGRWSTSAVFVDVDADGWLDLFVANYVDFTLANHRPCFDETSALDYCGPVTYEPYPDRLFRNLGDGTFEDITARSQVARAYGAGLGVISADLDEDGLVDLYVANDGNPNQFWVNRGDGTFEDRALVAGCAFNVDGRAEASMGIDAADFDEDGDDDLFMTHLTDETNTLYVNDGNGVFQDLTYESGLGAASRPYTGFGTAWIDYDNDGWLDLVIANGAVKRIPELARAGDPFPLGQRNQLFRNLGNGRFADVTDGAGAAFDPVEVGRGAAFGDIDNDGDTDVLLLNNSGPVRLLVNQIGTRNHWLGLRLTDAGGSRDAIGTQIEVELPNGRMLEREVRVAASYCSSNDPRVRIGLGEGDSVRQVRVRWPDGTVEVRTDLLVNRYNHIRQGVDVAPGSR